MQGRWQTEEGYGFCFRHEELKEIVRHPRGETEKSDKSSLLRISLGLDWR